MTRRLALLAIFDLLAAGQMLAGMVHIRDYHTHEPADRGVLFALAVTPDQDLLSLVAKGDGKWRLTRIHGWLGKTPSEQTIDVPGWPVKKASAGDSELLNSLGVGLFVTPEAPYAICVATGYWHNISRRGGRSDDLISVVDLRTFSVVKTIHSTDVGIANWQTLITLSGRLALQAETSAPSDIDGPPRVSPLTTNNSDQGFRLVTLALPELLVEGRCRYSESRRGDDRDFRAEDEGCAVLTGGQPSLKEFVEGLRDGHGFPLYRVAPKQACAVSGVSRDGRFQKESCEKYHLSAWNRNHVADELKENIVETRTGKTIGTVAEFTHNSVQSRFADQSGHDYLLIMEGGTKLKVYEIKP